MAVRYTAVHWLVFVPVVKEKNRSFYVFSSLNFCVYSTCRRDVKYIKNFIRKIYKGNVGETEAYIVG